MEDDIDDLLDEVETKFCTNSPRKSKSKDANKTATSYAPRKTKSGHKKSVGDDDLDAMIDDICEAPEPLEKIEVQREGTSSSNSHLDKKCFPVYLGGTSTPVGLATTMSQRSCDRLRCTDCDFKIVMYDNYEWNSSCDYLFLRNNMPDFNKLSAKLHKKKGVRAYACQCKWRSVRELVDLQKDADLKWVCGRHKL